MNAGIFGAVDRTDGVWYKLYRFDLKISVFEIVPQFFEQGDRNFKHELLKQKDEMMKKSTQEALKPDFSHLVLSIASTALLKMGLDPRSKEEEDRSMARYNIDLLSVLKEKTKNNLTKEEAALLDSCVQDLQLKFVQTDRGAVAKSPSEKHPESKTSEASLSKQHPQNKTSKEPSFTQRSQSKTSKEPSSKQRAQNKNSPEARAESRLSEEGGLKDQKPGRGSGAQAEHSSGESKT